MFEYNIIPFGLAIGDQVLARLMDHIFVGVKFSFVFNFLGELVVFSPDLQYIDLFFSWSCAFNSQPRQREIWGSKSFSYYVSANSVRINPERTASIHRFSPSKNKEIAQFFGMVNFFSEVVSPLNALRRKGVMFIYERQTAFQKLKLALSTHPVLAVPVFNLGFILQTMR